MRAKWFKHVAIYLVVVFLNWVCKSGAYQHMSNPAHPSSRLTCCKMHVLQAIILENVLIERFQIHS